jgi:hypothetical protein
MCGSESSVLQPGLHAQACLPISWIWVSCKCMQRHFRKCTHDQVVVSDPPCPLPSLSYKSLSSSSADALQVPAAALNELRRSRGPRRSRTRACVHTAVNRAGMIRVARVVAWPEEKCARQLLNPCLFVWGFVHTRNQGPLGFTRYDGTYRPVYCLGTRAL